MDTRLQSKGNVRFRFYADGSFANPRWPTATEMNAGQELEAVTLWDSFDVGVQASETSDAAPIKAKSNAARRAGANYGGTASFWYPGYRADLTNAAALVYAALKELNTNGFVVISVDGEIGEAGQPDADFSFDDGDYATIMRVFTDEWTDMITGEDPFYFTRNFVKSGLLAHYTVVSTAAPVLDVTGTGLTGAAGGLGFVSATVNTREYTRGVIWSSSNPNVASVSPTGVVRRVATGSATITATLPGTTSSTTDTIAVTVS